jgi:hypothetical protein
MCYNINIEPKDLSEATSVDAASSLEEGASRQVFRAFFEELFRPDAEVTALSESALLPSLIAMDEETRRGFDLFSPRSTPASQALARWFFEEMIAFLEQKESEEPLEVRGLVVFQERMSRLLSYERGSFLFRRLHPKDQFLIAARLNGLMTVETSLGIPLANELTRDLALMELRWANDIADSWSQESVPRVMSLLHLLRRIAIQAVTEDSHQRYAERVIDTVTRMFEHVKATDRRAFIQIEIVRMEAELRDVHDPALRKLWKPREIIRKDAEILSLTRTKVTAIAADAIAFQDPAGRLTRLAMIPEQPLSLSNTTAHKMAAQETIRRYADQLRPQFQSVFALSHTASLLPFERGGEMPLLIQHLHDPHIRRMVNDALGVNIVALPLRSQAHLAYFLANGDGTELDELKTRLERKDDTGKRHLLDSFFACAERQEMGDAILELSAYPGSDAVFEAYAKLAASADDIVADILKLQEQVPGKKYSPEHHLRQLIMKANKMLLRLLEDLRKGKSRTTMDDDGGMRVVEFSPEGACAAMAKKLFAEEQTVRNFAYLVASLKREDLANLNLETFSLTQLRGPLPVADVIEQPIGKKMKAIVAHQFPKDVAEFEEFLTSPGARMFYSMCGSELLGFFCIRETETGMVHMDWYSTNPDGVVPGLAEATLVSSVRTLGDKPLYAVVAPHVASSTTAIERLECVAYEETDEYSQAYLRIRRFEVEHGRYASQHLKEDEIAEIRSLCDASPLKLLPYEAKGKKLLIARVEFHGRRHDHDVNAGTPDGHIFRFLRELNKPGEPWVMPRYIPAEGNTIDQQIHYCVFERDALPGDAQIVLQATVDEMHQSH